MSLADHTSVTQVRFQPTLFLYLGTSAGQIGYRLKRLLKLAYGDVPVLRHLWIDIDIAIDPLAQPWFTDAERIELSGLDPAAVVQNIDNFPAIKAWWPDTTRLSAGMLAGGGSPQQMRLIGRLALFRMFNDRQRGTALITRLQRAAQALFQIENITAVHNKSTDKVQYAVEAGCRVIIVHSTSGGTGSSMSFDLAYLCRNLLRGKDPSITSFSVLPPVIDEAIMDGTIYQKEKVRANTYAWFKEDNYLTDNPAWNVQYPEGAPVVVAAPPYDYRFVIDMENQAGYRLNRPEDVYNMVAQAIFLDTGSSIAGDMRGFRNNVHVLSNEFQGMRCAFSSLAAASLIFPKERLLDYCSSKLGSTLLANGLLAAPDATQVDVSASTLLQQLRLRDIDLLADLLDGVSVRMHLEPAITKADTVAVAVTQVDSQEAQNEGARKAGKETVAKRRTKCLDELKKSLDQAIAQMAGTRGLSFALAVCEKLAEAAPSGMVDANVASLAGIKKRLEQQGETDADLQMAKDEFATKREALRKLDDGPEDKFEQFFSPKGWKKKFALYKNDTIAAMRKVNDVTLQLEALQQAGGIYDQLAEAVTAVASRLRGAAGAVRTAADDLRERATRLANATPAQTNTYEFLHEVDLDFDEYYEGHTTQLDVVALSHNVIPGKHAGTTQALETWIGDHVKFAAVDVARHLFEPRIQSASLLSTLEELADKKGVPPQELLESELDAMIKYCYPFWVYDPNLGLPPTEGKSIIGIEDERSALIPQKYRDGALFEINTTCVPDRIDIVRVQHGLPAFMLRGMDEYKAVYEQKRKGIDPLHVLPGMEFARDVMPERGKRNREWFAIAYIFDYIVQSGTWYYYDPDRAYRSHNVPPSRQFRLDQGREKAEEAFSRQEAWVAQVEEKVEAEIRNDMGNAAAIKMLDEAISKHLDAIAKMSTSEASLRQQYEKEIRALRAYQRRLS